MSDFQTVDEPYPGLRSFRRDETHIFFGREFTINDMVTRLAAHRFLAVTGTSGSGKSSVVRTGLLDALDRGLLGSAGADWRVADFRPGRSPLASLAASLLEATGSPTSEDERLRVEALLARGPYGLLEWLQETDLSPQTNLLLLADQFEEIFRFRHGQSGDDIDAFVALLLASARQRESPIYVVITMRSDFLGECSRFTGLAEAVNNGQYLTPRLSRSQCQEAIEGPAAVFGGRVESALANRLLNDMATSADQLPLVQHVLMRLWRAASERAGDDARVLKLADYLKLGGIGSAQPTQSATTVVDFTDTRSSNALSSHADEILAQLTPRQQRLAAILFRALTESEGAGGRDVRRPVSLAEAASIADVPPEELIPIIEEFRAPGRNLLTPPQDLTLQPGIVIDIGHESLIRQWITLRKWLREEYDAAQTYRHVETSAKLWEQGNSGLMTMPYLGIARSWREHEHPNEAWASRYGNSFALAMRYLDKSLEAERLEVEAAEAARRKAQLRTRTVAVAMAVLALVAGAFAYIGFEQAEEAARAQAVAERAQQQAVANEERAEKNAKQAELDAERAEQSAKEAERQRAEAEKASEAARVDRDRALFGQSIYLAELSRRAFADGQFLRSLLLAVETLPDRRWKIERPEVSEAVSMLARTYHQLAAQQSLVRERTRFTRFLSTDRLLIVSSSASTVWDTFGETNVTQAIGHVGLITSYDATSDGKLVATAGHDGTVRVWESGTGRLVARHIQLGPVNIVKFRNDGKLLVIAGTDGLVRLWDFESRNTTLEFKAIGGSFISIEFSPDGSRLATVSRDEKARIWDSKTGALIKELPKTGPEEDVRKALYTADGTRLLLIGEYKALDILDAQSLKLVKSITLPDSYRPVAVSRDGSLVAVGAYHDKTSSAIFDTRTGAVVSTLQYSKEVYDLVFTPDGTRLITASNDKGTRVWDVRNGAQLAVIDGDTEARYLALSTDGSRLATRGFSDETKIWDPSTGKQLGQIAASSYGSTATLSPDGRRLLWMADKGPVTMWDLQARKPVGALPVNREAIAAAEFSSDGRWLAVALKNRQLRIWSADSLKQISDLPISTASVIFSPDSNILTASVASKIFNVFDERSGARTFGTTEGIFETRSARISRDGRRFFTMGDDDPFARLWDVDTGRLIKTLEEPGGGIRNAALNFDGTRLITVSANGIARMFDASTGEQLEVLSMDLQKWDFRTTSQRMVGRSDNGNIQIWDISTGRPLVQDRRSAQDFAMNLDGSRVVTWTGQSLDVFDAASGRRTATMKLPGDAVMPPIFEDAQRIVVKSKTGGTITVWNTESGRQVARLAGEWKDFSEVGLWINADASRILIKETNRPAVLFDGPSGARIAEVEPSGQSRYWQVTVAFSRDGERFLFKGRTGQLDLWDSTSGKRIAVLQTPKTERYSFQFAADSSLVLAATGGPSARLWNARTGETVADLRHQDTVTSTWFMPEGERIFSLSKDGIAKLWTMKTAASLAEFDVLPTGTTVYYSDDGRRIVTVTPQTKSLLYDTSSWQQRSAVVGKIASVGAFSPDQSRILVIGDDNTVRILDNATKRELALLRGHSGAVTRATFSLDGRLILTFAKDKTARVWDADTGRAISTLEGHANDVVDGYFSRDGAKVLTFSKQDFDFDGSSAQLLLWDTGSGSQVAEVGKGLKFSTLLASPDGVSIAAFDSNAMTQFDLSTGKVLWSISLDTSSRGDFDFTYSAFGNLVGNADRSTIVSQQTGAVWRMPWTVQEYIDLVKDMVPRCLTVVERKEIYLNPDPPDWCIEMGKWPFEMAEWKQWLADRAAGKKPIPPKAN